ncbi:MAG: hypothetical protein JO293_00270 [Candidatus Eremiobacteraeota bacterium]|nr:hypothetical protein [Candidatus Eremiobacteraeota bacterium]MBV8221776.1 hypothetical protein [Candidatus Eremiobacteraeota bacterium]
MRLTFALAFCLSILAFASGCAKQSAPPSNAPAVPPSSFPVYSPADLVTSTKYDDSAEVTTLGSSFFGSGDDAAKPYIGVQELLTTSASLDQLHDWLKTLVASPPPDLYPSDNTIANVFATPAPAQSGAPAPTTSGDPPATDAASASPASSAVPGSATPTGSAAPVPAVAPSSYGIQDPFVGSFQAFGLVPSAFWSKDRGRAVMIIIMDPKQVADHLGSTMDLMDQYERLPAVVRGGIDQSIKKNTGFSVSDLLNASTPMGMIVYATRTYKSKDVRAIILVDALRQPNPLPTPHPSGG